MTVVSDYTVALDGEKRLMPSDGLDVRFNTGGRHRPGDAILVFNVRSLDETNLTVRLNGHREPVGQLYRYRSEHPGNWNSQQIVFRGSMLNDGDNNLEVDVTAEVFVKDIVCWFKQDA